MRIVSLLPSATEIIHALGLSEQLVGVTHECDYPPSVRDLPKVTHTLIPVEATSAEIDQLVRTRLQDKRALYTLDVPMLEGLRPDLLVTQALCDVCAVAEEEVRAVACLLPGAPRVLNLEPERLAQVFEAMRQVAQAAGAQAAGEAAVAALQARVEAVVARTAMLAHRPRVALLEWLAPPFTCGHWSPELVELAGGVEVLGHVGERSRQVQWEEVVAARPEVVVIACCGYTVERTLADVRALLAVPGWADLPAVRAGRVYVVDGAAYFSRPGPRLVDSLEILAQALHPEVHVLPAGLPQAVPVPGPAVLRAVGVGDGVAVRAAEIAMLLDAPHAFGGSVAEAEARTAEHWETRAVSLADSAHGCGFVGEDAYGVCAFVYGNNTFPQLPPGAALIGQVWVAPRQRGTGLGLRLMEAATAWAVASGAEQIVLGIAPQNLGVMPFYTRLGYSDTGMRVPLEDGREILVMGRRLTK